MDAITIALAFVLFGCINGVGLFLVIANTRAFFGKLRARRTAALSDVSGLASFSLGEISGGMFNVVMAVLGVALLLQGILWPYIMVFR